MKQLLILLFCCLLLSCNNNKITLEGVRYTPEYFRNDMIWGESETAMKTMNLYLLETGVIDTTSETPPIQTAFIAVDSNTIQLNYTEQNVTDNEIIETYKGNSYTLTITKKRKLESHGNEEIVILISKDGLSSKYELIGKHGFQ